MSWSILIAVTAALATGPVPGEERFPVSFSVGDVDTHVTWDASEVEDILVESELFAVTLTPGTPLPGPGVAPPDNIDTDSMDVATLGSAYGVSWNVQLAAQGFSVPIPDPQGFRASTLAASPATLWSERVLVSVVRIGGLANHPEQFVYWRHYEDVGGALLPMTQSDWDDLLTPVRIHAPSAGPAHRYYDAVVERPPGPPTLPHSQAFLATRPVDDPEPGGPVGDPVVQNHPPSNPNPIAITDDDIE